MTEAGCVIRMPAPKPEPRVPGETTTESSRRLVRNRQARKRWEVEASAICSQCGHARINVIHETDPATSPEGLTYYSDFLDELHGFVP